MYVNENKIFTMLKDKTIFISSNKKHSCNFAKFTKKLYTYYCENFSNLINSKLVIVYFYSTYVTEY